MTRILTPQELVALQTDAEYGGLDHSTASKRHVRILVGLHFVLSTNTEPCALPYANLLTISKLIDRFFGKRYAVENLLYWIHDLLKRGYVVTFEESEPLEENFFSLTEDGIKLFESLYNTREALFESNTRNSISFLN